MPAIPVEKLDVGINSTLPSDKVTWATGRNVRFTPGYVSKTLGKEVLTFLSALLPIRDLFSFMAFDGSMYYVICCNLKVFLANNDFSTITDITPVVAPTGDEKDIWDFTIVAGLPILTNGKDNMWKLTSPSASLVPMTHGIIAKNISNCMHHLVCSNIVENGYTYTGRVRWMERGNPENAIIDTSKKSGYQDLVTYDVGNTIQHKIVAQVTEGSIVYLFTDTNVWISDFSEPIKQFIIIDSDFRIFSKKSVCVHNGDIYALEIRDIYKFGKGKGKIPIGLPVRAELLAGMNVQGSLYTFCFPMYKTNEIWFCVSTVNDQPDTAYIYNWELDCWAICDCDFLCHASYEAPSTVAWINNSGDAVTWKNSSYGKIDFLYSIFNTSICDIAGDSAGDFLKMDSGFNKKRSTVIENFEWGNDGDNVIPSGGSIKWKVDPVGSHASLISITNHVSGTKSLRLYTDGVNNPVAYFSVSSVNISAITFYLHIDAGATPYFYFGGADKYIQLYIQEYPGTSPDTYRLYYVESKGHSIYTGVDVNTTVWDLYEIKNIDFDSGTYDIYYDSLKIVSGATMVLGSIISGLVIFQNLSTQATYFYVDDITIFPVPINGVIETGDFVLGNRSIEKMIEECFPDLTYQTEKNSLMIQVGTRQNLSLPLTWSSPVAFKIGKDSYSDLRNYTSLGAFIRLRFYSNELDSPWSMSSYSFNYSQGRKIR